MERQYRGVIQIFVCKTGKYQPDRAMLQHSHKPEVLRLHDLESRERERFRGDFGSALAELLPSALHRKLRASPFLTQVVNALPDLYYTLTTLLYCRRRLGEEYTYIAMYHPQHYEQQGLLLNRKTRLLLAVLELVGRNLILPLLAKFLGGHTFEGETKGTKGEKVARGLWALVRTAVSRWVGSAEEVMSNVEWAVLMVYLLDWNKHFTFLESLLGIEYVYTYKNDKIRDISYKVEGYLLLATFAAKLAKTLYSAFVAPRHPKPPQSHAKPPQPEAKENDSSHPLCRICYDQMKNRSSTHCGHVFCWSCITQTLEITPECPVCRAPCLPRQVVTLRNF